MQKTLRENNPQNSLELKLQSVNWVKNDPKYIFQKITSECSMLSARLSSIQNG